MNRGNFCVTIGLCYAPHSNFKTVFCFIAFLFVATPAFGQNGVHRSFSNHEPVWGNVTNQIGVIDDVCCEPESNGFASDAASETDSFPTVKVTGFFQLDSAWFTQDETNLLTLGDIDDGLGFRRARFAATGNVAQDISYVFEFDIAQSQARFVDVWLQASNTRFGNVGIGRYRQPFGMSEQTSIRDLPFLERPVTFTQSPFRQTGVMLFDTRADELGTWAISGYRFLSDNFGNVFSDSGGYGMVARLTAVPFEFGENRLLRLGADYSYNEPGRGVVQFVSTNEVFVGQNPVSYTHLTLPTKA